MIAQVGPIGPSDLGLWAITFLFGAFATWLVWLTFRHYKVARPVYERVFGQDADRTNPGHLVESQERFDHLDEAHALLQSEVHEIRGDVRHIDRRQEVVLKNQKRMSEALGVDVDEPFRSGRRSQDAEPNDD